MTEQLQQSLDLPGPRISRITIGRLHNLGNYEHIRFEVTVELPPGASPASVLHDLSRMLHDIDPKSPISSYELQDARKTIAQPPNPEDRFDTEARERANQRIRRHNEWAAAREAAMKRFDDFGGTKVYTDAKEHWDDGDY